METVIAGVNYDESGSAENLNYKSTYLHYGELENKFDSGDFVKDWFDLIKFYLENGGSGTLCYSSSVDHFIMDGAPFDSAYLHIEDDKAILKYIDRTDERWYITQKHIDEGVGLFVEEGTTPTWDELKSRCGFDPKEKIQL